MASSIRSAAAALRRALVDFDVALFSGPDCAHLAEELAATEKACAAARARAAARAAECGAHRDKGYNDAAEWLARTSGSSAREAKTALETAGAAERCPATAEALARGELSLEQAAVITRAESECPGSETELLEVANRESLQTLRDEARKRRLDAVDPEELAVRQRRARHFRHWRDDLGMVCGTFALEPLIGIPFLTRLEAECDRVFRRTPRDQRESRQAHAADAFAKVVEDGGKGRAGFADLVVVCDVVPFRRGHSHPGETCHIVGGGPVPVSVAREIAEDGFIKAVIHDGVRIETVAHFGRHIPAELRTALELGSPPRFEGTACAEADCGRRRGLQWDHDDPVANHGPTSFDNLRPLCWPHHQEKTERDRRAGLLSNARAGPP